MPEALPQFGELIAERMTLLRQLAASLESSQLALVSNDAQAIARGAAHQAELCRNWSLLETELRRDRQSGPDERLANTESPAITSSQELQAEWEALYARIRHLARVHWSLLRHLERSMNLLRHIVESARGTYAPDPQLLQVTQSSLPAGD